MLKCLLCWMRTSDGNCRWYRQNHHIPYYAIIPTVSLNNTCSYSRLPVCHIGPAGKLPANHESHYYLLQGRERSSRWKFPWITLGEKGTGQGRCRRPGFSTLTVFEKKCDPLTALLPRPSLITDNALELDHTPVPS